MRFQSDPKKAASNRVKHAIDFAEASTVFGDPLATTIADAEHSFAERRLVTIGLSMARRLIVVVHVERGDDAPARQRGAKRHAMKKAKRDTTDDDMRPEYDFSRGVRGKYFERYQAGSNVVVLEPDVSEAFPNAASVNEALRVLVRVARTKVAIPKRSSPPKRRRTKDSHRKSPQT